MRKNVRVPLLPKSRLGLLVLLVILLSGAGAWVLSQRRSPKQDRPFIPKGSIEFMIQKNLAEGKKPNRLINEKSPYLLQHAFNPVDWYPCGEEAFKKARDEQKPIFLSIGYSTCYWCHVMEREVFENDSIAALMNQYVVSIKVDREERPDVDRVYMSALQAMSGSGGWPMSMFLTPDLKPFFGATYIPAEPKYGRASFPEILTRIHEIWQSDQQQILAAGDRLAEHLKQASASDTKAVDVGKAALEKAYHGFARSYDPVYGGFSPAPKFPRPTVFNFLLRYYKRTGEKNALEMTLATLKRMALSGMYDHIGGGFHRYATDERWHVPHFEKMLYDQAQLAVSYLEAYQITQERFYADVARNTLRYIQRVMTHPDGGFYSAEDAESALDPATPEKKEEGAFYVWSAEELHRLLTEEEFNVFKRIFGVERQGNVTADPHGVFVGKNILSVVQSVEDVAKQTGMAVSTVETLFASAKKKAFSAREQRPHPHLDDKVLASWNGLMISAFARAYQVLDDPSYLESADRATTFIMKNLYTPSSHHLLRRYRDGEARFDAHLEDYAFLVQWLIDTYEAGFDIRNLQTALQLTEEQLNLFYDQDQGSFFDVSGTDPSILIRTKEWYDGAEPSGNSVAILNLLRLAQMTGNDKYAKTASQSLASFGGKLSEAPHAAPQMLVALDFSLSKPKQIIIAGSSTDAHTKKLLREIHSHFIPNKILLLADGAEGQQTLASYVPFIGSVKAINGKSTAYVCENYACQLPTSDIPSMAHLLR